MKRCIECGLPLSLQTDTCYSCRKKAIHDDRMILVERGILTMDELQTIENEDLYLQNVEVKRTNE